MRVFYLHGFASSARSKKAAFFARRFHDLGIELICPDFNEPAFETMTVTRMIDQVLAATAALPPAPIALIGSSLGAFVAWHTAARHRDGARAVERLVLLAPALDFGTDSLPANRTGTVERWRATDRLDVFHFGYGEFRTVQYALFEDAQQHDSFAVEARVPTLVFQGRRDTVVNPAVVERFARDRPLVRLRMLDDDHQLLNHLELMWSETVEFLGLCAPSSPSRS